MCTCLSCVIDRDHSCRHLFIVHLKTAQTSDVLLRRAKNELNDVGDGGADTGSENLLRGSPGVPQRASAAWCLFG